MTVDLTKLFSVGEKVKIKQSTFSTCTTKQYSSIEEYKFIGKITNITPGYITVSLDCLLYRNRKEATLAAIDAALEYLSNNKK